MGVCVIIAAFNARSTIGRAIASALAQPEAVEVIVIDDASTDNTAAAARASDDGTGRLRVHTLPANAGPSAARNVAIANSRAPLIAILDADDFLLPGRFADLLAVPDWDMIADNIAFVAEENADAVDAAPIAEHRIAARTLSAAGFVAGCLSRAERYKGELGFLKPVLSRAFLDSHALRYDEGLRLAEDYDLYVRALIAGARFRLAPTCGYVAVDRIGSLSSDHGFRDLANLEIAIASLLAVPTDDGDLRRQLRRHRRQIARKRSHHQLLDRKREAGVMRAILDQVRTPVALATALLDVARDKIAGSPAPSEAPDRIRFLL